MLCQSSLSIRIAEIVYDSYIETEMNKWIVKKLYKYGCRISVFGHISEGSGDLIHPKTNLSRDESLFA